MRPTLSQASAAAALSLLCLAAVQAGEKTYRWIDEKGRVHYSDVKSAKGEQVQVKPGGSITTTPKGAAETIAARQLECQRRREQVALYKTSTDINETDNLGRSRSYTAAERQQLIDRSEQAAETACSQPGVIDTGNASSPR